MVYYQMPRLLPLLKRARSILRILLLPILLTAFLGKGLSILPGYRFQMNPDGVSYLTIAQQYQRGHWLDAVNAYWSPLYSWLLVPLLQLGVEPLLATKVLALLIGAGVISCCWWLGGHLRMTVTMRVVATGTLMPILYYFGMIVTTPDLLMTCAVVLYLAQMTTPDYHRRWHSGIVTGLFAGLAYLAKAYALPFVVAHLACVSTAALWTAWRSARSPVDPIFEQGKASPAPANLTPAPTLRRVVLQTLAAMLVLSAIAGAWGSALKHKYGHFNLGSTGRFNLAWNGPKFSIPMHEQGFLAPPNSTGTSGWDDATLFKYATWNPIGTPEEQAHFSKNRLRNWRGIATFGERFTWLFWPILVAAVVCCASRADPFPRRPGLIVVLALLLFPVGYYLLHVEERFLSALCILLLMTAGFVIGSVSESLGIGFVRRTLAVLFVAWTFIGNPKWNSLTDSFASSLNRWSIASQWNDHAAIREQANALAGRFSPRANIASIGQWAPSLYLAYLLDLRYFGESRPHAPPADIEQDLKKFDIDYLWVWDNPRPYPFLKHLSEITGHSVRNLHVYRVKTVPATLPSTRPAASSH